MKIYGETFPVLVAVGPWRYDEESMQAMSLAYEPYFEQDLPYALLSVSPRDAAPTGAKERRVIADWANSPRVRERSGKLCAGSAVLVPSALARGAFTALLWFWTPPSPLRPVGTIDEGLDYCFERLAAKHIPLRASPESIRRDVKAFLHNVV